jgi:ubiquinone biosynthesis protein UbiJ
LIGVMWQVAIRGLNHLVRGESWAQERLRQHAGARLVVEAGWVNLGLAIDDHGFFRECDTATPPDVTVTLPADSAMGALLDRDKLFAAVKLGGSAEVAECLAFVFRNLKWDAEGDLAGIIGDIPARRLAILGQAALSEIKGGLAKATGNITEYVVEDSGMLLSERELAGFGADVNCLSDDVARLEKRISGL